jgi:hypothetical protein
MNQPPTSPLKLIQQNKCDPLVCPTCAGEGKLMQHKHIGKILSVSFIRQTTGLCPTCRGAGYVIHWHASFIFDPNLVHGEVGLPDHGDDDDDVFGMPVRGTVN